MDESITSNLLTGQRANGNLGLSLRDEAALQTLPEEVLKSSEIEGEVLDREQVRSSIARRLGMDIGGLTLADRNVEGVVEMLRSASGLMNTCALRARHGALLGPSSFGFAARRRWRGSLRWHRAASPVSESPRNPPAR